MKFELNDVKIDDNFDDLELNSDEEKEIVEKDIMEEIGNLKNSENERLKKKIEKLENQLQKKEEEFNH